MADVLALSYQRKYKYCLLAASSMAIISIILLWLALGVYKEWYMFMGYPVLFCLAWATIRYAKKNDFQDKYLDYRCLAEAMRVHFFWSLLGFSEPVEDYYQRKHRQEIEWIRIARRNWSLISLNTQPLKATGPGGRTKFETVEKYWLNDQYEYFDKKSVVLERSLKRLTYIKNALSGAGAIMAAFLMVIMLIPQTEDHRGTIVGISGVIISMCFSSAAAISNYLDKLAYAEQGKQFLKMKQLFQRARAEFARINDEKGETTGHSEMHNLLVELGEEALCENGDWLMLHRSKPLQIPRD